MAADTAVESWLQPSGGGSEAAVVWQHWTSGRSAAAVVASSVLRGVSIGI